MPNVTISVPDELKAEMDTFPEVSWSEVCRKAIAQYIDERKYPTPNIELDVRDLRLDIHHISGYPTLSANVRIHNKMNSEIIVDRVLFNVRFYSQKGGKDFHVGSRHDLYKRIVNANSIGGAQIILPMLKEKVESLEGVFTSTFPCIFQFTVFAEGFRNPYNQEVWTEIPIDKWKEFTSAALKTHRDIQVTE